ATKNCKSPHRQTAPPCVGVDNERPYQNRQTQNRNSEIRFGLLGLQCRCKACIGRHTMDIKGFCCRLRTVGRPHTRLLHTCGRCSEPEHQDGSDTWLRPRHSLPANHSSPVNHGPPANHSLVVSTRYRLQGHRQAEQLATGFLARTPLRQVAEACSRPRKRLLASGHGRRRSNSETPCLPYLWGGRSLQLSIV